MPPRQVEDPRRLAGELYWAVGLWFIPGFFIGGTIAILRWVLT